MTPRRRPSHLLAVAAALGCGAGLALAPGCQSNAQVHFTGTPQPQVASADQVELLGAELPAGFKVIGVVTAVCETLNGASGVFDDTCSDESLTALLRRKAAESGAHALADLGCRRELLERSTENVDGGGVKTTTRERLTCQATGVRRRPGAGDAPIASGPRPQPAGGRRVKVGDATVAVAFTPAPSYRERGARGDGAVGELERAPAGYETLGRLSGECVDACSPSQARRGLVAEATRLGATALAEVRCELGGAERWRCEALVIGEPIAGDEATERADAGAVVLDAEATPLSPDEEAAPDEAPPDASAPDAAPD